MVWSYCLCFGTGSECQNIEMIAPKYSARGPKTRALKKWKHAKDLLYFFNVGPPKEDIFLITLWSIFQSSYTHFTGYNLSLVGPLWAASIYCTFACLYLFCNLELVGVLKVVKQYWVRIRGYNIKGRLYITVKPH